MNHGDLGSLFVAFMVSTQSWGKGNREDYIRPRREIDLISRKAPTCGRVEVESQVMQISFEPFKDLFISIVNRLPNHLSYFNEYNAAKQDSEG